MKYEGTVGRKEDCGDEAEVSVINIRRRGEAEWRDRRPQMQLRMPHSMAKAFELQRRVVITIEPRGK